MARNRFLVPKPQQDEGINTRKSRVEQHGIDLIPEGDRTMRVRDVGMFWVATNLYIFNFSLGVIAFSFGLPMAATLTAVVVGNLSYVLVALGSIPGMRSGVPTMIVARASFGRIFNRGNSFLAWLLCVSFEVVNVVFGVFAVMALFELLGWRDPGTMGKIIALIVVYVTSVAVAYLGHATVVRLQKVFAVALSLVMAAVAIALVPKIDWQAHAEFPVGASAPAIWLLIAGVVAAAGLAYMQVPSDYTRYLPSTTSSKRVFWTVLAAAGGTALVLSVLGVLIASQADLSDPVGGMKQLIPSWLFVFFVISVIGGSIGNNVITLYSSAFAVQTMGIPVKRYQATIIDAICSILIISYVLFVASGFLDFLNNLVTLFAVWVGPFGAIYVVDSLLRGHRFSSELVGDGARNVPGVNWRGVVALLVGAIAALLTINAPAFQGPLSSQLFSGADLSWLAGPGVGGLVYWLLSRRIRPETNPSVHPIEQTADTNAAF